MGIYVGCLPSHVSNVALILNPRTDHASPQYQMVYDDDFTTVPYVCTAVVLPQWAELVSASLTKIALCTECKVGTCQSLPKLDVKTGDFTSDNSNIDTAPSTTSNQHCKGDGYSEGACDVVLHHIDKVTKQVTFSNKGEDNEIQNDSQDSSTTQPDE